MNRQCGHTVGTESFQAICDFTDEVIVRESGLITAEIARNIEDPERSDSFYCGILCGATQSDLSFVREAAARAEPEPWAACFPSERFPRFRGYAPSRGGTHPCSAEARARVVRAPPETDPYCHDVFFAALDRVSTGASVNDGRDDLGSAIFALFSSSLGPQPRLHTRSLDLS